MKRLISTLGLFLVTALPASAQQLKLTMNEGRVTLEATNVPARQILTEWARIGSTNVVGADKITGAPLTLKIVDMPEAQALDIILRNVAGFMAAPRRTAAIQGQSAFDRILIMATSTSAAAAASASARPAAAGNVANGTQRRVAPPRPPNLPPNPGDDNPEIEEPDSSDNGVASQPVFTFPPQGAPGANQPVFVPIQNGQFGTAQTPGGTPPPVINLTPSANGPTIYNFVPNTQSAPAPAPTPTTPFGPVGSATPGMIQAPPPTPGQPTPIVRPPG